MLEDKKEARAMFILISYVIYPGLTLKMNFRRALQLAYIHRLNKELEVCIYKLHTYYNYTVQPPPIDFSTLLDDN